MVTADHGPAVSGAHNTIVAARAGKDLVSSLVSGLLTIGPRFGGALDDAARMMSGAVDKGMDPLSFTKEMRKQNKLIMGIGHRIKSLDNPDMRVVIIKDFAQKHFPSNACLDFALGVEQITTSKRANLILNVDGCIAVCFVDLMRTCGAFTREEADEVCHCLESPLRCRAVACGPWHAILIVSRHAHVADRKWLPQRPVRPGTEHRVHRPLPRYSSLTPLPYEEHLRASALPAASVPPLA